MPLHNFVAGESASVAENLDANFAYLLGLIQQATTLLSGTGAAAGTSTALAVGAALRATTGLAQGSSTAVAINGSLANASAVGTAAGTSTAAGVSNVLINAAGNAAGSSTAAAFSNLAVTAIGAAAGTSTAAGVGASNNQVVGAAAGTSTALAVGASQGIMTGTAAGTSTAIGHSPAQTESAEGFTLTLPSQTIFASPSPGAGAQSGFNLFTLPNAPTPGAVSVNGTPDNATSIVMELVYHGHFVYRQDSNNLWFSWASAGSWTATASPFPAPPKTESTEGTLVTTPGPVINASRTPGTAQVSEPPLFATFALVGTNITFDVGQPDAAPAIGGNVVQLVYSGHVLWQQNQPGEWWTWNGPGSGDYTKRASSPIPTGQAINVARVPDINTNATFVVQGTLAGYTAAGAPAVTNLLRNSKLIGGATGAPGIPPTRFTIVPAGTVATIVSINTAVSPPYIDINFTGTATGNPNVVFDQVAVLAGTNYNLNYSLAVLAGGTGTTNVTAMDLIWNENGAAGWISGGTKSFQLPSFPGATLVNYNLTGMTSTVPAATSASPGFIFVPSGAINMTVRISGVIFNAGMTPTAFQATPFAASTPTLQYQDSTANTVWNNLPSNANVNANTFLFVHPPVTAIPAGTGQMSVQVRDSTTTSVVGLSNNFSVSTPGVVTLLSITTNPTTLTFGGSTPAGTPLGVVVVTASPANGFVGTGANGGIIITGANASKFSVNASNQIVNSSVLPPGRYDITIVASQANAIGTPLTLNTTIVGSAESAAGTTITGANGSITAAQVPGSLGATLFNVFTINNAGQVAVSANGGPTTAFTQTGGVVSLYYIGHSAYQYNGSNYYGPMTATSPGGAALAQPPQPQINVQQLNFTPVPVDDPTKWISEPIGPSNPGNVSEVTVLVGGSNNVITLALAQTPGDTDWSTLFSFGQAADAAHRIAIFNGAVAPLWTVGGFAIPTTSGQTNSGDYPITIIATIV